MRGRMGLRSGVLVLSSFLLLLSGASRCDPAEPGARVVSATEDHLTRWRELDARTRQLDLTILEDLGHRAWPGLLVIVRDGTPEERAVAARLLAALSPFAVEDPASLGERVAAALRSGSRAERLALLGVVRQWGPFPGQHWDVDDWRDDPDPEVRLRAIETHLEWSAGGPELAAPLAGLFCDEDPRIRRRAAALYERAARGWVASGNHLAVALADERSDVRLAAASALEATSGRGAAVGALVSALYDVVPGVREKAALALARMRDVPEEQILRAAAAEDPGVRRAAIVTIGRRVGVPVDGAEEHWPGYSYQEWRALLRASEDPDPGVRSAVAFALRRAEAGAELLGAVPVKPLKRLVRDGDRRVRLRAAVSLLSIGAAVGEARRELTAILSEGTEDERLAATMALGAAEGTEPLEMASGLADPSPRVRLAALRAVARAEGAAVAMIAEALEDDAEEVRVAAARILERLGPAAAPAVPAIVSQASRSLREGERLESPLLLSAANVLRAAGADAIPDLLAALPGATGTDEEHWILEALLAAARGEGAGGEGRRLVVRALRARIRGGDGRLRVAILERLVRLDEDVSSDLVELLLRHEDRDPDTAVWIVDRLPRTEPGARLAAAGIGLSRLLRAGDGGLASVDLDRTLRILHAAGLPGEFALTVALWGSESTGAGEILRRSLAISPSPGRLALALRSSNPAVRRAACEGISSGGLVPRSRPGALRSLLRDPVVAVRYAAARALARLGGPVSMPAFRLALAGQDPEAQAVALAGIRELGRVDLDHGRPLFRADLVGVEVVRATQSPSAEVRRRAAAALGPMRPVLPVALTALRRGLDDPDDAVRLAAADAVGEIGRSAATLATFLGRRLEDPSRRIRQAAADSLAAIGPGAAPAASALVRLLRREVDSGVRSAALRALGRVAARSPVAREALRELSVGQSLEERVGARRVLLLLEMERARSPRVRGDGEDGAGDTPSPAAWP